MSTNRIVWGLKIYLPEEQTPNHDIGLYTDGGVSTFRWIETYLENLSQAWAYNIIRDGGIPAITEGADSVRGGTTSIASAFSARIDNTEQFNNIIETASVYLGSLRCEIIEFSQAVATGVVTETIRYRGVTNSKDWSPSTYTIPIEPAIHNRRAQTLTDINVESYPNAGDDDIGKLIPATLGTYKDRYAKMIRASSKNNFLDAAYLLLHLVENTDIYFNLNLVPLVQGLKSFPVVDEESDSPVLEYMLKIAPAEYLDIDSMTAYEPDNLYMRSVDDISETVSTNGEVRKIVKIEREDGQTLKITVDDVYSESLTANGNGNGSWCRIAEIIYDFHSDVWPSKGFYDTSGEVVSDTAKSNLNLYTYFEPSTVDTSTGEVTTTSSRARGYYILPDFAYEMLSTSDKNTISITPQVFNGTIDTITSMKVLPLTSFDIYQKDDLTDYGLPGYTNRDKGAYSDQAIGPAVTITGSYESLYDRDSTTSLSYDLDFNHDVGGVAWCFVLGLPERPQYFEFDSVHIIIRLNNLASPSTRTIETTRWLGGRKVQTTILDSNAGLGEVNTINMPSSYLKDTVAYGDFYYYYSGGGADPYDTDNVIVSGGLYSAFSLTNIKSADDYDSIQECILKNKDGYTTIDPGVISAREVYSEIGVGFKKDLSIKENIYAELQARVFNDTWGGRKTATDLIEKPVDQFEHFCRLQNWSEEGDTSVDYGKEYSASALINTGYGDGGFASTRLSDLDDRQFSFQILKADEGWTDVVKKRMCRAMWCVNYQNEDGEECLEYLPKTAESISDTVNYGDIPTNATIGDVQEPEPKNVYAEPFVRYNYNAASGKFDGLIGIKQVQKGTWSSEYTPGFSGSEGEYFYDWCHENLWKRYRQIEPPPSDMTDQYYISKYDDAKWFLTQWLDWMLVRRITVPVYYEKANSWHPGKHIYLNLPHQTNGSAKEAVIEKIVKDKNSGICVLSLAYWITDLPADEFYVNFTYDSNEGGPNDWNLVYDLQGDDNDKNFVY